MSKKKPADVSSAEKTVDETVDQMLDAVAENQVEQTLESTASVAADQQEAAVDELTQLREQLIAAQQKADQNWDLALRTKAEMENLKRRTEQDIDKTRKFALEKIAQELLAIRDSMELGLEASASALDNDSAEVGKLHEGNELTLKMLSSLMEKFNIVQLNPVGEPFNPEHHQAISMQANAEYADNTVSAVMQKGYLINERLLRPAMVIVVKN